jgi:hypothetical protein
MLRWLLLAALFVGLVQAANKPPRLLPLGPPIQAVGFGVTAEEARKNAVQNALERAAGEHPEAALSHPLIERYALLEASDPVPSDVLAGQPLLQVRVSLTLTRELLNAAHVHQRELRARERQFLLAQLVAGFLLVFAVVAGYLQLEEWTKGYATRLLRLLAAVALIAGFAFIFLMR